MSSEAVRIKKRGERERGALLMPRHEIGEPETVAQNDFAKTEFDRAAEIRSVVHERMKLAVLAAGVDVARKFGEELVVDDPAREAFVQFRRIDAHHRALETEREELPDQSRGVAAPDGIDARHAVARQEPVAIRANVGEKQIPEHHRVDPAALVVRERLAHLGFVLLVGRAFGDPDLTQWQPETLRLSFQQDPAHAMHADAVEVARDGGEERFHAACSLNLVQRQAAILPPAP